MEMTASLAKELGYKSTTRGALITKVTKKGTLKRGMVITSVEWKDTPTLREVQAELEKGSLEKGILLQVRAPQIGVRFVLHKLSEKK